MKATLSRNVSTMTEHDSTNSTTVHHLGGSRATFGMTPELENTSGSRITERGNHFPHRNIGNKQTAQLPTTLHEGPRGLGGHKPANQGATREQDLVILPGRAPQQQKLPTIQTRGPRGSGGHKPANQGATREQELAVLPGRALQQQNPPTNQTGGPRGPAGHQSANQAAKGMKWSTNPHFRTQIYNCMRYARTTHAIENWQSTPRGVTRNLNKMVASVKPIGADRAFGAQLHTIIQSAGSNIRQATITHLEELKLEIQTQFLQKSRQDEELIFTVATRKLLREFSKIPGRTIRQSLMELARGTPIPQPRNRANQNDSTAEAEGPDQQFRGASAPPGELLRNHPKPPLQNTLRLANTPTSADQNTTNQRRGNTTSPTKEPEETESRGSTAARALQFSSPKKTAKRRPHTPPEILNQSNRFQALSTPDDDQLTQEQIMDLLESSLSPETPEKRHKLSSSSDSSQSSSEPDELNTTVICLAEMAAEAISPPKAQCNLTQQRAPPMATLHRLRDLHPETKSTSALPTIAGRSKPEQDRDPDRAATTHQKATPTNTMSNATLASAVIHQTSVHLTCDKRIQQGAPQSILPPTTLNSIRQMAPLAKQPMAPPKDNRMPGRPQAIRQGSTHPPPPSTALRPLITTATENRTYEKEWPKLKQTGPQSRQRTRSITPGAQAKTGPPNPAHQRSKSAEQQTPVEPVVHWTSAKQTWRLQGFQPQHKILIMGDSNARGWRVTDPTWLINSFSGVRLEHVAPIVARSAIPPTIKTIVIAIGVNNRNTRKTDISRIMSSFKDSFSGFCGNLEFLEVPQLTSLKADQVSNLDFLHDVAQEAVGPQHYIMGPPPEDINAWMPGEEAHYDYFTGKAIVSCIENHIKTMRLN